MRNHFLRAGGIPSTDGGGGGSSFDGVTDNLLIHYDFSDTSCWNRNKSSNAADYTINNLAGDHNDAHIRRKVSGNTWTSTSDTPTMEFNSVADGCIQTVPGNYTSAGDNSIIMIPGSESSSTASNVTYNMPTESDTSANNMFNIGTGAFTLEWWFRIYIDTAETHSLPFTNLGIEASDGDDITQFWTYYDPSWSTPSSRGDIRIKYYIPHVNFHANTTVLDNNVPGKPASGAAWSDWIHMVYVKESGFFLNGKTYVNNTHEHNLHERNNYDYGKFARLLAIFNGNSPQHRLGIFRFYQGKGLTSSEVTTNWNDQKARFGH